MGVEAGEQLQMSGELRQWERMANMTTGDWCLRREGGRRARKDRGRKAITQAAWTQKGGHFVMLIHFIL